MEWSSVNSYNLGPASAGTESFQWDGMTGEGVAAPEGAYHVSIEATGVEGEELAVTALNYAQVGGVSPADDSGQVQLDLGAVYGQVALSDIRQIL